MEAVRVRLKVTLRAGPEQYAEGSVFTAPFPDVILKELEEKTGTVEVLETNKIQASPEILPEEFSENTSDLDIKDKRSKTKRQRKKPSDQSDLGAFSEAV